MDEPGTIEPAPTPASGPAPGGEAAVMLREYLRRFDTPCPGCGYNLRGLTGEVCPECAQRLRLSVGLVEPKMGALIAGVIGLSVGIGFSGIFLAFVAWMLLFARVGGGFPGHAAAILIATMVIESVLLWWWLSARGSLRRMTPPARWGLALGAWGVSATAAIVFFATVQ